MGSEEELVIIVDEANNEIGTTNRWEMRANHLTHRATYILVFNSQGELFVQKRTQGKDVFPGYYDAAAGGVVVAGETYEDGAERELAEELGITETVLTKLFNFHYRDDYIRLWGRAFSCVYDGQMILQKEEVESGKFMHVDDVFLLAESEPFTPDCLQVLGRYLGRR